MIHDLFVRLSDSVKKRTSSISNNNLQENAGGSHDGRALYRFQNSPISTEIDLSYVRPLKREWTREKFDSFIYRDDLRAVSYDDAIILPGKKGKGGVVDNGGQFVGASKSTWFGGAYDLDDGQTIDCDDRTVVFLGEYATRTWGHVYISLMVRFWYCLSHNDDADAYVIISEYPKQKQNSKPLNDLIRLSGLEKKTVYLNRPTRFKRVIVPEPSFTSGWYSDHYWETIDTIKEGALKEPHDNLETPEKVFLSRSHFYKAKRCEGGLQFMDHYFKRNGFAVLHPQEIPLTQMIQVMQNAVVCASDSGSITFNTFFGNPNLHAIVVERNPLLANGNMATNLSRAKRITYIDGCYSIYPGNVGGACMLGFTDELERFTNDNQYRRPLSPYVSKCYKKKCFNRYERHYKRKNTYEQWKDSDKRDLLPVVYEAFLASIDQFPWLDKEAIIEKYYQGLPQD